jgi:hypothetical protein
VVGAEPAQLAFAAADLVLELVDQAQARPHAPAPGLGQLEASEQSAAAETEQIGDGTGLAVRKQDCVHPLLQARAVADEVQTPARPLPLSAHL